jgi:hypothetical protein
MLENVHGMLNTFRVIPNVDRDPLAAMAVAVKESSYCI